MHATTYSVRYTNFATLQEVPVKIVQITTISRHMHTLHLEDDSLQKLHFFLKQVAKRTKFTGLDKPESRLHRHKNEICFMYLNLSLSTLDVVNEV